MPSVPDTFDTEESLDYVYASNEFYQETFFDVWVNCVVPSGLSIFYIVYKVILVNLCFSVIVSTGRVPQTVFHILSGFSGLLLISSLESTKGKLLIFIFFTQSYFLLHLGRAIQNKYDPVQKQDINKVRYLGNSNIIKYILITTLVLCEYYLLEPSTWLEIRGIVMVFTMKLISLVDDMDKGVTSFPKFSRYFGYIFCGANIMFGPWISFQDYNVMYHHPTRKNKWWIYGVLRALVISVFFLMVSNCWTSYFITDDSNRWLIGYKEALSFRTSHYFICYLSEASMLAAGYKNYKIWYEKNEWRFFITDPFRIEVPNALATVVTNWNRPMHEFLKRYIYKSWLPLGKFYGILATFFMSSFLHGFEIKVSVILITIGIFSYLQLAVRDHLAQVFDCCIRVYPCKENCTHKYKRSSITCRISLLVFSISTVLHLIYLGVLMDSSTHEIGIYEKWNNLYFVSFWLMIVNILIII
ncbi:protein-serine O-palmitoleoyltransferase porcupine [Anoplophora glabripennis]|uniref:protein-serine O-palmitoleoyltransferase porcupine n=1 Tax=Anoplophora glabripennis TaxID=217634 RepID=UPI0008758941|nr:protein-serine O-palmitoleoyltransferase porcupine [Anoplophora glabripennis]